MNAESAAGSSGAPGTPLWRKLGLKPGMSIQVLHADPGWSIPLEGAPEPLHWLGPDDTAHAGLILAFFRTASEYVGELDALGERIRPDGTLWAAWPRKAAGHVSDLGDTVVRDAALERGIVDVKVAAISPDWSGLKLVWRLANR